MRQLFVTCMMAAALSLAACATTQVKSTTRAFEAPAGEVTVMLLQPDVELSLLMASGMTEVRADWSEAGEANIAAALQDQLGAKGTDVVIVSSLDDLSERQIQLIKLNEAVLNSIGYYEYGYSPLPTKKGSFDWTLGPGAMDLAGETGADFVLLVQARGSYQSSGKVLMNVAMAALGGPVQTGGQGAVASLVDLRTGDVVWVNLATAATGDDMRQVDGAQRVTTTLLKDFPL